MTISLPATAISKGIHISKTSKGLHESRLRREKANQPTCGSFTAVTLSRHFPIIPDLTVDPPAQVFDNIPAIRGDLVMGVKSPDHVDVEVGQRIRIQRNALGLSQTELADHLGVTFQQVQKYEKGVNRVGAGRLTKIANALQVPVTNLLGMDDSIGGKRKGHDEPSSPLKLLTVPGALRLLRAYGKLTDGKMRRSILQMVEIAGRRHKL
jgi:transcriptional regulator with XRE-family HTH domain